MHSRVRPQPDLLDFRYQKRSSERRHKLGYYVKKWIIENINHRPGLVALTRQNPYQIYLIFDISNDLET